MPYGSSFHLRSTHSVSRAGFLAFSESLGTGFSHCSIFSGSFRASGAFSAPPGLLSDFLSLLVGF